MWLAGIWLLGMTLLAARFLWARGMLVLFRLRHRTASEPGLAGRAGALARRLGIRRPVTVLESTGLTAPVAFGCFRPTLALPATFARDFDRRSQEAVIVHELAHLAAGDPAWQAIADLACVVLWWHPLAWWSRRRLRSASEVAADEASRLLPEGADLLASCLIALGRRLAGVRPRLGWLSMGGMGFRSELGRRVERLLSRSGRPWRAPGRGRLGLARATLPVVLAIVAVFSTAWAHPRAVFAEGGTPMNVFQTSWRRSLAAAALVAVLSPFSAEAVAQEERAEEVPVLFDEEGPPREGRERDRPEARREGDQPEARREREHPEARERERGERGEREVLVHEVEVLGIAAHALREAERGDAIELVERAIHARKVTLEGRRDDEAHMIRERAPGREQLADVLRMAAGLWREFGNQDKAHAVAELAETLRVPRDRERPRREREREGAEREQDEMARPRREQEEARQRDLRAQVARRIDELKAAHVRAREAGREDEAGRILRQIEEIKRQAERHPERGPLHPEERAKRARMAEREEMERRMHHIRVAVENLRAAGLHEQAERLAQQMEHMRHPDRPHPDAREHPSHGEGPPPAEHLEGVLRELHEAVRHLHERVDEMTRHVEEEIEAIHREMGEFAEEFEEEEEEEEEEEGHDDDDHDDDHDDEDDDHHEEEEEDDD
jgi:beta-lactamase regulating signal transducer with metallopeptidase domain